jgi:hypothetical protein
MSPCLQGRDWPKDDLYMGQLFRRDEETQLQGRYSTYCSGATKVEEQ